MANDPKTPIERIADSLEKANRLKIIELKSKLIPASYHSLGAKEYREMLEQEEDSDG